MSSQGPNSPSTGTNTTGVGTVAWVNTGNVALADSNDVTAVLSGSLTSNYLSATNFGFSIPGGATIDGIVAEFLVYKSALGAVQDNRCRIIKGGTIGSTDKANGTAWPAVPTPTYLSHGGVTDLWGETWTDTDINQTDFGVALSAVAVGATVTARVDYARVTVYYTLGSPASVSLLCLLGAG